MDEERIELFITITLVRTPNGAIDVRFQSGGEGGITGLDSEALGKELTGVMVQMGSAWMKELGATPMHAELPPQPTVQ